MNVEFCQKLFLLLLRWSYVLILQLVNVVYHIDWFVDRRQIPLDHRVWPFWCALGVRFANILLRISASMFISDVGLSLSLCVCYLCLILVSQWWWPYRMSSEVFLPLKFLEDFEKYGVNSSLNVWIHLWRHLLLDFGLLGFFKSPFQCLWLVCSYFLFFPDQSCKLYLSNNLSISFRLSI